MLIQGQVGAPNQQASIPPGTTPPVRQGQLGDLIVSELHGKYYETNYRQAVFSTFVNAYTVVSTNATPIAAGTGLPIIGVYNPIGSGKNLSLIKLQQVTTSGTPGGPLLWNLIPNPQNITASTNATATNMATLQTVGSVTKIWNGTAITGSTAGTAFRNAGGMPAVAAVGTVLGWTEQYDGTFIVPPGAMIALAATATGTSQVLSAYLEWEEIPI